MSPGGGATFLIWRRHHKGGELCPKAPQRSRPAWIASPGERKPAMGPCGCPGMGGGFYQADEPGTVAQQMIENRSVPGGPSVIENSPNIEAKKPDDEIEA